jgi:hypothetical protein
LPPPENVFASAPLAPKATETLDSRVRRLTQILATSRQHTDTASGHDESAAALRDFATVLPSLQQLTQEVRTRVGAGDWDAGDVLAARLLLDAMTAALRSCRVVSHQTTSRLHEVHRVIRSGHRFVHKVLPPDGET